VSKLNREAELEALARFAAAGKVKKLAPVREKDPDEAFTPRPLTYTLGDKLPKLVWFKMPPKHVDCDCMSCRPG
jgi:hypothetical protein